MSCRKTNAASCQRCCSVNGDPTAVSRRLRTTGYSVMRGKVAATSMEWWASVWMASSCSRLAFPQARCFMNFPGVSDVVMWEQRTGTARASESGEKGAGRGAAKC